jgi:hypothetical protein
VRQEDQRTPPVTTAGRVIPGFSTVLRRVGLRLWVGRRRVVLGLLLLTILSTRLGTRRRLGAIVICRRGARLRLSITRVVTLIILGILIIRSILSWLILRLLIRSLLTIRVISLGISLVIGSHSRHLLYGDGNE